MNESLFLEFWPLLTFVIIQTVTVTAWLVGLRSAIRANERAIKDHHHETDKRLSSLGKRVDGNVMEIRDLSKIHTDVEVMKTELSAIKAELKRIADYFISNTPIKKK